jgi:large subunit ribosomal protein L9
LEKASDDKLQAAQARSKELTGKTVEIAGRASEEGKLFGSVGLVEISEAFAAKDLVINKSELQLPEGPIKMIGEYEVAVSIHTEVHFTVNVVVVAE